MKSIKNRKKEIFDKLLVSIDKDLKIFTKNEAVIVSLTFEKTFEVLVKLFESELRNNYYKKKKKKIIKEKKNRLQTIK